MQEMAFSPCESGSLIAEKHDKSAADDGRLWGSQPFPSEKGVV